MENRNNKELQQIPNYIDSSGNAYSSKELPSFVNKINNKQKNFTNIKNQNQNNFIMNNLQKKISLEKLKNNSLKKTDLKKFHTQKNLRRININTQKNNQYVVPDGYNIVFAKKTNMYLNNNGNFNISQKKNLLMNNDNIAKKLINKCNDAMHNYKKINKNYNPKFYSSNSNNIILNNNNKNNNFLNNNIITKKISDNIIKYNFDLNSTMPNKTVENNNFNINTILNSEKKLSMKPNINNIQNNYLNDSILLNSKNSKLKKDNKTINSRTMTDYKNKNRGIRNDLSWDYGIGILNKGQQLNFYKKNNNINHNNKIPNFLSERKKKLNEIDTDAFNNDDSIDDKDIDEIVDNLNLSFFNDNKKNNTVILSDKGFSDDSLSDIANDIVKTFKDTENEDINIQETVPSSSNPELDGITSSNTDIQYNNNFQNQKKIIYETKSTIKPTIVNNFFISSNGGKNNTLDKDINYNLFVVNEYNNNNNKINANSNIPTLITRTYKSPNILREEKNNKKQNNINEIEDIHILDDDITENKIDVNINDNNLLEDKNKILALNYQNPNHNNLIIPNVNNNIKETEDQYININVNNYIAQNNYNQNINNSQIQNNNQLFKLDSKYPLKNNLEKNSNEINVNNYNLKDILSSNKTTGNNIQVYKENKNFFSINDVDKKNLLKNKIKKRERNNFEKRNIYNNNYSFNKNNNIKFNNYENNFNNINISTNNIMPIYKNNYIYDNNTNLTNNNIPIINKTNDITKNNNILIKNKRHISFNLNNNIFIKFKKDDFITKSEITSQNGQILNQPLKDKEFKLIKPKPIIKTFLSKDIKINKNYVLVENLPERQILPDLYDDFEEDELKSLEKSLEGPVDKILK